jgi:hypothetical protein
MTAYALYLEEKLDQKDDERDKLDVAEWLESYPMTKSYVSWMKLWFVNLDFVRSAKNIP